MQQQPCAARWAAPRFPSASLVDSPYDEGKLAEADALLADLSRLKTAREKLIQHLKAQVNSDEIADVLVLNKNNEAAVFDDVRVRTEYGGGSCSS